MFLACINAMEYLEYQYPEYVSPYTLRFCSSAILSSLVSGPSARSNKPQNLTYGASPNQTTTFSSAMGHYFRWHHSNMVTRRFIRRYSRAVLHDLGGFTAPEDIIPNKSGVLNPTGTH